MCKTVFRVLSETKDLHYVRGMNLKKIKKVHDYWTNDFYEEVNKFKS